MNDKNAFERQVAGRILHHAGPIRPVDDGAIFNSITSTRAPGGRFHVMFSATKFVLAGAIVALFGGFLLAGVVTQPGDDGLPAVGAPASAQAGRTEATASEPMTDVETDAPTTTTDLLPGTDLVTEEIAPGVSRVLSDGLRDLSGHVQDVAVNAEGEVWLELGSPRKWSVVRLGAPGASETLGRKDPWPLGVTSDGVPVVSGGGGDRVLDGATWSTTELPAYDRCALLDWTSAIGPDGNCWVPPFRVDGAGEVASLERFGVDGTRTEVIGAEIGLRPDQYVGIPVVAPDGTIWADVTRREKRGSIFEGLAAYDGTTWSLIPYEGDENVVSDYAMAVDSNGVVWISRPTYPVEPASDPVVILSWDGESWASHEKPRSAFQYPIQPWPNGVSVFGSQATRWDGTTLSAVDLPVRLDADAPFAMAPDGTAWTVLDEQLYAITPDAVVATE
jgi:hypothetical protein